MQHLQSHVSRTVLLLGVAALLCQCAVPIRYAVPTREVVGREIFARPVVLTEGGSPERFKILAVELNELDPPIEAQEPDAEARLQAAIAANPPPDVVLVTNDTRSWPSVLLGAIFGQIGLYGGLLYATANDSGPGQINDNAFMTSMAVGTAVGVFAGVALGNTLSSRVKTLHLVPEVARPVRPKRATDSSRPVDPPSPSTPAQAPASAQPDPPPAIPGPVLEPPRAEPIPLPHGDDGQGAAP